MSKSRLEYLDSARGIAALTVVCSHFKIAYLLPKTLDRLDHTPLRALWFGEGAVVFFFILSGYVISLKYFSNKDEINKLNYVTFLLARIFRIYPLFLVVLLLSLLSKNFIYPGKISTVRHITYWIEHLWQDQSSYFHQALLITKFREDAYLHLIPQSWTLQLEMLISALIPFFIVICLRSPAWMFVFSFVIVAFMGFEPYLIGFILGIAIAYYSQQIIQFWGTITHTVKGAIFLSGLFLYCSSFMLNLDEHSSSKLVCFLGTAVLLIVLIGSSRLQNLLKNKVLVFLGSISYGIYLSHMIILLAVIPYLFKYINNTWNITDEYATRTIGFTAFVLLSILLSYLLHISIEKPFISLYRKINGIIVDKMAFRGSSVSPGRIKDAVAAE